MFYSFYSSIQLFFGSQSTCCLLLLGSNLRFIFFSTVDSLIQELLHRFYCSVISESLLEK